jgi:hypothetical protein
MTFQMRAPCKQCGHEAGRIVERGSQDTVRCLQCDAFAYNAPRTETGNAVRSISTTHAAIKPGVRYRVLERANGHCELCRVTGRILHVAHFLSVKDGHGQNLTDAEINSEHNLCAMCEECNLGGAANTVPVWLAAAIVRARAA